MSRTSTELPKSTEDADFDARKNRAAKLKDQEHRNTLCVVLTDMLFVLLPFIVTGIVLSSKGKFFEFIIQPEWALAASVISGQAIVKCMAGYLSTGESAWQKITLLITAAIVLCFTPSLLVFTLIVNSDQTQASIPLLRLQVIVFFVGLLVFLISGWLVEKLRSDARYQRNTTPRREGNVPSASKSSIPDSKQAVGSARFSNIEAWNHYLDEQMALEPWQQYFHEQLATVRESLLSKLRSMGG